MLDWVEDCPDSFRRNVQAPRRSTVAGDEVDRVLLAFHHAHQKTHAEVWFAARAMSKCRLAIGSSVGWAGVFLAALKANVSSARGDQRLCARPIKSIREVRKPDGFSSAAINPIACECLSQARIA